MTVYEKTCLELLATIASGIGLLLSRPGPPKDEVAVQHGQAVLEWQHHLSVVLKGVRGTIRKAHSQPHNGRDPGSRASRQ